jgi:chromatin remodeling complex protein RSC6
VARTTVTTALRNYIKEHQLQNPENKREILPDAKLAALFGEEAKDVRLNMFNMQKYINRHFPSKKTAIEVVA